VIVDEAQDLHPAQWRLLRQLVPPGANDLFIVGDPHQRIYDNRVRLSSLGIPVRGRSEKLRVNYRTTYEILRWSLGALEGQKFDDLDGSTDDLRGYRSMLHGPAPVVNGYPNADAERKALAEAVRRWISLGVPAAGIGVAARTAAEANQVAIALRSSGIPATELGAADATGENDSDPVSVGTMHGMKGLEFRCVAVVGAHAGLLPHPSALTPAEEDPLQHAHDLARERSLLFVACTRARDALRVSWHGTPSPFLVPLLA
jgi:superfamily I DNA/RNA helicase